ncbi:MAG: TGS domain-containing protein, partial [Actinobacteria bacterium]|nr:TGS domain-containing protein [Actinomycetota bacterium]
MASVTVGSDKQLTSIDAGATAYDVVGDKARQVVVARINGELVDLSYVLQDGDHVEPVLITEPEGLSVLRHSAAHVVAQATQAL